jgi:PIN domain nuclease of toxin-antitoxin system
VSNVAVADTHALLFHTAGASQLGRRAAALFAACELQQAVVYVPAAAVWEVATLSRARPAILKTSVRVYFEHVFSNPSYQLLDVTAEQIFDASELGFTRDPFDGLIVAAARSLDVPLVTRDEAIRNSGAVRVIW